ncbi:tectonin domain-containing protein [Polyangium sp. 6x1]|uniref:tectonin domain-containing protein n=1 Tax=Polyangium sp. 6x1 TaxID=3042689 RepID=UPI002483082B|nr:tectonin domain-containing protein [Polyangium sp. 6x1]MDI1446417.1 hypothetical protein [Polyangium sp. 6x1]
MILGLGTDNTLLLKKTVQAPWEKLGSRPPPLVAMIVLGNGVILGVGKDTTLWKQDLSGTYKQIPNSQGLKGGAVRGRLLLGLGVDNMLYERSSFSLSTSWGKIANTGDVISLAVMPDKKLLGVGTDNLLYTRSSPAAAAPWVQVPGSGAVKSVAVTPDGTLVGVGMDNVLYTRATLTSPWVQVPGSGPVVSVAAYPFACDATG